MLQSQLHNTIGLLAVCFTGLIASKRTYSMDEEPSEKLLHSKVLDQSIYVDSKETTEEFDTKRRAIETACQDRDVKALVEHATSPGGLLTDTLRQAACMCDPFWWL